MAQKARSSVRMRVPFTYRVNYVKTGHRKVEHAVGHDVCHVEVSEATEGATLAFRIAEATSRSTDHGKRESVFYSPAGKLLNVYTAENAYWLEIVGMDAAQAYLDKRNEHVRDPFSVRKVSAAGAHEFAGYVSSRPHEEDRSREYIEQKVGALRRWDESDQDRVRLLLQIRTAEDIRVIDGKLCMRISEPCLYLDQEVASEEYVERRRGVPRPAKPQRLTRVTPIVVVDQVTDRTPAGFTVEWGIGHRGERYWRANEKDRALAWVKDRLAIGERVREEKGVGHLNVNMPVEDRTKVEVVDPAALRLEGEQDRLLAVVAQMTSYWGATVAQMRADLIPLMVDLRHAREQSGDRLTPEIIDLARRLSDAMKLGPVAPSLPKFLLSGLRGSEPYFSGVDVSLRRDELVAELDAALRDWDGRPRDGREWVENSLPVPVVAAAKGDGNLVDVVEVTSLQKGQALVDQGCDPSVVDAAREALAGRGHLIAVEEVDRRDRFDGWAVNGFAAFVTGEPGSLTIERIFEKERALPSEATKAKGVFEIFVAANASVAHDNKAIEDLSFAL